MTLPLTAKVSTESWNDIRRISNKPRNPANQMSPGEEQIFESIQLEMQMVQTIPIDWFPQKKPDRVSSDCTFGYLFGLSWGQRDSDTERCTKSLAKLYPMDKATGYKAGELRGLFQVTLPKN